MANIKISELIVESQTSVYSLSPDRIVSLMSERYSVMRNAVAKGISADIKTSTGLSGGDAFKMNNYLLEGRYTGSPVMVRIIRNALAVSEVNANMGKIVAAPTAGSCGIIPGLLTALEDEMKIPREIIVMSLFTASAFGSITADNASVSGADAGCQAECGTAAGMAAAAACEILGGTPVQCGDAFSLSLINSLGLVCDPVGGYVEYPCVYRNALGAVNAFAAVEMALAGIRSIIPADEVIMAMKDAGNKMHPSLRETSKGGLAAVPSALKFSSN